MAKAIRKPRLSTVIKNYNNLLVIGVYNEYLEYGGDHSEIEEEWNIRDFVAEVDFQLSKLTGDSNCNDSDSDDEYVLNDYWQQVHECEKFIRKYAKHMEDYSLSTHCSQYDNKKKG